MFRPLLISLFLTSTALADTWTVDDDGKADFDNIQAAIDAASDGDEIIVMPGTYTGTGNNVVEMPIVSVTLRSSNPTDPEIVASTIIDGENKRRGLFCNTDVSPTTIISGLTFTNGLGNGDGGGMLLDSSITVKNCRFEHNLAAYAGGGLRITDCSALIEDCDFLQNSSYYGGGVSIAGDIGNQIFTGCDFVLNSSTNGGCGGAVSSWNCNAEFYECAFYDNTSECGGAIFIASVGEKFWPLITDSIFCGNVTEDFNGDYWTDGGGNGFFEVCNFADCNNNGVVDMQDLADGTSDDCNGNGIPDECDLADDPSLDCDGDGVFDSCAINDGLVEDCNGNNIPDSCEIDDGTALDCNGNGVPDECDIADGTSYDCDNNLVPDECQPDCDGDGFIDPCDNEPDCDEDGIPDNCETDCQPNGIPDDCDIIWEISEDDNDDGIPDECQDCNKNGVLDPEDIENGTSEDADGNGIPDECQYPITWTVDDDGEADFDNIQAAIDAASSLPNLDDILVYPGTYPAGINMLGKEVWLHSSDGPEVTIIDGEETQFGIACESGETNDTVIEGFTITHCIGLNWSSGGAMTCIQSSPTIINCVIDSNHEPVGSYAAMFVDDYSFPILSGCKITNNGNKSNSYIGPNIFIYNGSHLFISDSILCGNYSSQICGSWTDLGGTCISVSCDDSDGDGWPDQCGTIEDGVHHVPDEFPTIQQAINAAGDHDEIIVAPGTYTTCEETMTFWDAIMNPLGKRLWIHSSGGAQVTIIDATDCLGASFGSGETPETVIEGFTFTNGYRQCSLTFSAPTFKECVFINGTSDQGAVCCSWGVPVFENCSFTSNELAVSLSSYNITGGWPEDCVGTAKFTNCTFSNNNSGGASWSSCIDIKDDMDLELSNCLFENNGGKSILFGFQNSNGDTVITDCVFRNNDTLASGFAGGLLEYERDGNFNMQGCLFESNRSAYQLKVAHYNSNDGMLAVSDSVFKNNVGSGINFGALTETLVSIENSTVKGNSVGGISGYYLVPVTITNTTVCSNEEYQIDNDGWIDGGGNTIAEVCFNDCQAADITDDGIVDVNDMLAVLGYWGSSIPAGDVDGNGVVGIGDLLMVVGNWGACE